MKKFRSTDVEGLRLAINLALENVGADLTGDLQGMTIEARNCSYSDDGCTFKLHCELGDPGERRKREFMKAIPLASVVSGCEKLTADHYGVEFKSGANTFVFDELSLKRPAFPIGATKKGSDRHYKFKASAARLIIENANESI